MTTNESISEKRIARDHATDEPDYIGRDEHGGVHFWSKYDRRVIVVEDGAVGTCDLSDTDKPLARWRDYTARERGWVDHQIAADPIAAALEAL